MKQIVTLLFSLLVAVAAWGQNPLDRPMETFPTARETHIQCQEAWLQLQGNPALAPELVTAALLSGNRVYSNAVLGFADETAGPRAIVKAVKKVFPSLSDASKADVLYWIGRNRLGQLQALIDRSLVPGEAGEAAVFAAIQLGGAHNKALLDKLDGPLAALSRRLLMGEAANEEDSTRNSLRDSK